jgi:hypothetical protein
MDGWIDRRYRRMGDRRIRRSSILMAHMPKEDWVWESSARGAVPRRPPSTMSQQALSIFFPGGASAGLWSTESAWKLLSGVGSRSERLGA